MACLDRETATAYLRGDLEPPEAERWAAHVASCRVCRLVVEAVSALIDDVRQDLMTLDAAADVSSRRSDGMIEHRGDATSRPIVASLASRTFAAAVASAIVLGIVLWVRGTPVSAAEILQRATTAERVTDEDPGGVLFRVLTVEERRGAARTLISRRRVETWRRTATPVSARRAYDEAGRLVAAEWIDRAGARTLYASGLPPARNVRPPVATAALLRAEQAWRVDLSASAFSTLIGSPAAARAIESANALHISYESALAELPAATLTLSKPDLRAVEQTVRLGRGDDAREFRIAEDRFGRVALEDVAATVFDVDADLERSLPPPGRVAPAARRLSEQALLGLEVHALELLDTAGALLGEQVDVARMPGGIVRVEAMVDSARRAEELERALAPLARNTNVRIHVETFQAAARRQVRESRPLDSPHDPVVRSVEVDTDDIAVAPLLQRYFASSDPMESESAVAARVRTFANQAVDESRLIVQHAWATKNLAGRYGPDALRLLDESSRTAWRTLIRQHATVIANHGARLRRLLQPAFFPDQTLDSAGPAPREQEDVGVAAEAMLTLAYTQDDAVRTALATSTVPSTTTTFLQTRPFWSVLTELVTLAQRTAAE